MKCKHHLPFAGVLLAAVLLWLAIAVYPGGTSENSASGYSWSEHFISTLFHHAALNGAPNVSRFYAIPAMTVFCISIATMFWSLAASLRSPLAKLIRIGGLGSMVYAGLAVITPMHDLLVTLALAFFLCAIIALLHAQYLAEQMFELLAGVGVLMLVLVTASMYYLDVMSSLLPVSQKLVFALGTAWIVGCYYRRTRSRSVRSKFS